MENPSTPATQSPSIAALAAALAKAQGAMGNVKKDNVNPHFKSKYADLASVIDASRAPLAANGLAVVQLVSTLHEGGLVRVTTKLLHSSGEWLESSCELPVDKRTAQGIGSAVTYGRRYALQAMLGIAAEDDDGEAASANAPPPQQGSRSAPAQASARQSRTEEAKERIRKATAADMPAEAMQAMAELAQLQEELKIPAEKFASIIKGATGKPNRNLLNMEDVAKVKQAIDAVFKGELPLDS